MTPVTASVIESAVLDVLTETTNEHQQDWRQLEEQDLWIELVSCILGSRVRHEVATAATERLCSSGVLSLPYDDQNLDRLENTIGNLLHQTAGLASAPPVPIPYPFPWQRAKYLRCTIENLYYQDRYLTSLLRKAVGDDHARSLVVEHCMGIGMKQASLFLTNIYFSSNIAVIDAHVYKFMLLIRLANGDERVSLPSTYIRLESALRSYAKARGHSLAELDLAIWIVMRTVSRLGRRA